VSDFAASEIRRA